MRWSDGDVPRRRYVGGDVREFGDARPMPAMLESEGRGGRRSLVGAQRRTDLGGERSHVYT